MRFFDPIRFFFSRPEPRIDTREARGVLVVTMRGRFADASDTLIRSHLKSVAESEPADLLVNLADAVLVGNHAVGTLMSGLTRVRLAAKCVKLVRPAHMDWWLAATRVPSMFELYEEEEEALQSFYRARE